MPDVVSTLVVHALGGDCTGLGSKPDVVMLVTCPTIVNRNCESDEKIGFHAQTKPA